MSTLTWALMLIAACLAALGFREWATDAKTFDGKLVITECRPRVAPIHPDEWVTFLVTVQNQSTQKARIVGAQVGCKINGCFGTETFDLSPMASGESRVLEFQVIVHKTGLFREENNLFIEVNGCLETLTVLFEAEVVEAASPKKS